MKKKVLLNSVFKTKKLIISIPPRAGKSYISSLFCAWMLGNNPTESIMRNSYSMEIASKFSYDVRNIIVSAKYSKVFPAVKLKADRTSITDWALDTALQGSYFCSGVGGSITGKGCSMLAILDDPIKNIEDALSSTILEKTWSWYTSTHLARMESGCAEIQIATRWSVNDVIGKLLEDNEAAWHQITIPALTPEDKSFCEEIKTTAEYLELKRINDVYIWNAEYMQLPITVGGLLYPTNELKRYHDNNERYDSIIAYCDSADTGSDYLCALIAGLKNKKLFILDVLFTQEGMEITERKLASILMQHGCKFITIESNSAGKIFARNVGNILNDSQYSCKVATVHNSQNKETRILVHSGIVKETVYFKDTFAAGSDYDLFFKQFTSYIKIGKNKHDDSVDAVTGLVESSAQFNVVSKILSRRVKPFSPTLRGYYSINRNVAL